jgi:hypothetical protein
VTPMLLNHARASPYDWFDALPSKCPDCEAPLFARRGEIKVWHWAHYPARAGGTATRCAPAEESEWHLGWKLAYNAFPGWRIEWPVVAGGAVYRADACNPQTGAVREFVHSLSPSYVAKHLALSASGRDVLWVFDGDQFVSARRKLVRGAKEPGYRRLLKPAARRLHARIGGVVHWHFRLWKEWGNTDVWYPTDGAQARAVLERFAQAGRLIRRMAAEPSSAIAPGTPTV